MAERRMFCKSVVGSDAFLDLPLSAQAIYFHLGMSADDDGFVNNPRTIQRMVGGAPDDLKLLAAKGFVIPFESGVLVITHWKKHNYIQKDRYRPTECEERNSLTLQGGVYQLGPTSDTKCIQTVSNLDTQDSIGKVSIGKVRLNNVSAEPKAIGSAPPVITLQLNTGEEFPITQSDVDKWAGLFPAVDVMQQLRAMKAWCEANPTRRKTRRGVRRFVTSWLTREQDRGGQARYQQPQSRNYRKSIGPEPYREPTPEEKARNEKASEENQRELEALLKSVNMWNEDDENESPGN